MWQTNDTLIQLELSVGRIQAATPYNQQQAQIIGEKIQYLQQYLWQNEGLYLPPINYRYESQLQSNEVVIYFGLEVIRFLISNFDEILNILAQKVREYHAVPSDINSIRQLLSISLGYIQQGNYQYAFVNYQKIYYHSIQQNYQSEVIQSLAAIGYLWLSSGNPYDASLILSHAFYLASNSPMVDANYKAQIALNSANAFKCLNNLNKSLQYYNFAVDLSYYSGNSVTLFLALIGIGEIHYIYRKNEASLFAIQQAALLVNQKQYAEMQEVKLQIKQYLYKLQEQVANQSTQANKSTSESMFDQIKQTAINALIQSGIMAIVFNCFKVKNVSAISLFGSSEYKFFQPIFNEATVIGERNIQRIIRMR